MTLPGPSIWREVDGLHHRIHRAREAGLISRHEARQLRRQADLIETHAQIYGSDGLSASEQTELRSRTRIIESAIPPPTPGGN